MLWIAGWLWSQCMATILAVTVAGVACFRERLGRRQWLALGVILAALVLLNI